MYSGKINMILPSGTLVDSSYRLNPKKLKDITVKSNSSDELLKKLSSLDELRGKWSVDKDTNNLTRFKIEDRSGDYHYLMVYKSSPKKSDNVYSRKVTLAYDNGVQLSLHNSFDDVSNVWDEVEKAKDAKSLCNSINKIDSFNGKWSVDKDTSKKTVLRKKDAFGSDMYMTVIKESFDKVEVPNLTNVPMTPDGVGGGMPTRWIYSTYGRFLSVYGIRNKISVTFNTASSDDIQSKLNSLYKMRDNGLVDNTDLQELEERLRTMSNVNIYGNGSTEPSQAAISESFDGCLEEGKSLSSKYSYAVTTFNKDKMQKKNFKPWNILSLKDTGDRDSKGDPWVRGAFGNAVISVKSGKNGADGLYLATDKDINNLKNMKSEEDVLNYIKSKCKEVNTNKVDYDDIFDVKVDEEVKPTTSQAQLDHLEKIRPLAHTDEANAKRRKTIEANKVEKLLGMEKK